MSALPQDDRAGFNVFADRSHVFAGRHTTGYFDDPFPFPGLLSWHHGICPVRNRRPGHDANRLTASHRAWMR